MRPLSCYLLMVFIFATFAFSIDAETLLWLAMENDPIFQQASITYMQAADDYQRSIIYSSTKLDAINAEITFLKAKLDLRNSLKSLIDRIIGGYFDALLQKLQVEIAENEQKIASNQLEDIQKLYEKGMANDLDVKSAKISKEKASLNLETAKRSLNDTIEDLFWYLGIDSTDITLPVLSATPEISLEYCLANDLTLKQASLSVTRASLQLEQLINASEYEISKAKRDLKIAKLAYKTTYHQKVNALSSSLENLSSAQKELNSLKEDLSVIQAELNDLMKKLEKGLVDENQVLKKKSSLLTKKKEILQKIKEIVLSYLKLMVDCGILNIER